MTKLCLCVNMHVFVSPTALMDLFSALSITPHSLQALLPPADPADLATELSET